MIYTVGRTRDYLFALACRESSGRTLWKLGRRRLAADDCFFGTPYYRSSFPGGSVWATRDEAQGYVDAKALYAFAVFGVDATWEQTADALEPGADGWRDLLIDAPVRRLEADYYQRCIEREARVRRQLGQRRRHTAE